MAAADKNVVALLNGIARRDYFGESEITNEFLHQELFADLEEEQFQSMLKKYETLMRNIISADMDFNQLEAFLTSQMKRKQVALTHTAHLYMSCQEKHNQESSRPILQDNLTDSDADQTSQIWDNSTPLSMCSDVLLEKLRAQFPIKVIFSIMIINKSR